MSTMKGWQATDFGLRTTGAMQNLTATSVVRSLKLVAGHQPFNVFK